MTPVLAAASTDFGDTEVLRTLLAANANLGARTNTGLTALDLAKKHGHIEMLAFLK
jgi:ankyrin repeat protein